MTELDRRIHRRLYTERPDDGMAFLKTIDFKDLLEKKHRLLENDITLHTFIWIGMDNRQHQLDLTVERINKELRRRIDSAE